MRRAPALLVAGLCLSTLPAAADILTSEGLGRVRIGMGLAQAERALGKKLQISKDYDEPSACTRAGAPGAKAVYMLNEFRITRIDIFENGDGTVTREGAGIGTTEARIRQLYGQRAVFSPHPYTDGHYVEVKYPNNRKIIFETDGKKVTSFRSGMTGRNGKPGPVDYIEGCL